MKNGLASSAFRRDGFTLPEMLVVIGVLSIVGILVLIIFTNTLRGSNKSQIIVSIKQNGQSVLESMSSNIRNSDNLVCPQDSTPVNTLAIVKSGIYTRYRMIFPRLPNDPRSVCMNLSDSDLTKPTNGCIAYDNPAPSTDPANDEVANPALFVARVCNPDDPMSNFLILTDTNPQTGVSVSNASGLFTKNKVAGFKDNVTVNFLLSPAVKAPAYIAGQIDPVAFKTTIQLR